MPRWSEDPTHIIGVLANYLRLEDPALSPDALFTKGAAEAALMIKTLSSRAEASAAGPSASPWAGRGPWPASANCPSTTW